jgi:TRAP-type C4-dicarboxylate transport system permease small subunit
MDADSMLFLQISQRMAAMILPVGFGLIMVQFLLRMIVNVVAGVHGPAPEEPAS